VAQITIPRPSSSEYAPFYAGYVGRVPDGDLRALLRSQIHDTIALLGALGDRDAEHRYAPGKWSVKEVVGHMADSERIMAYRALCFARRETKELPGFDENAYVEHASFGRQSLAELLEGLRAVRDGTNHLFAHLDDDELARRGTANGREVSVRALAYIIAGHERHHVAVLQERYLPGIAAGAR
jgi:uncharacterized damage-inducible protein DinB